MIYLKKFNESINHEFYHEITHDGFWNNNVKVINCDASDMNILSKCLSDLYLGKNILEKSDVITGIFYINKQGYSSILIKKTEDEWYYVRISGSTDYYYKCDQIEGVLQLLKDKRIK